MSKLPKRDPRARIKAFRKIATEQDQPAANPARIEMCEAIEHEFPNMKREQTAKIVDIVCETMQGRIRSRLKEIQESRQ